MLQQHAQAGVDERTVELIAARVTAALRDDLEAILVELSTPSEPAGQLTVGDVARQLGVARSTVYAHWREWGGYKLGRGSKAPIRFDGAALPIVAAQSAVRPPAPPPEPRRARWKRRRRDLIADAPRLNGALDGIL